MKILRRLLRVAGWTAAVVLVASVAVLIDAWPAFGGRAEGARLQRMSKSPQWSDAGHFVNPQPILDDLWKASLASFNTSPDVSPTGEIATVRPRFETAPSSGLRVTWLGHSTSLIEIDGHRVLMDPIWSERSSPLQWIGPQRWYAPPVALAALPVIDAVVISHDHYDHLDHQTLVAMKGWDTKFVVPLGVGAHLEAWGVPVERIVELDWWERTKVKGLEIVATPSRHASGRTGIDKDATLWAGFALLGEKHRAYYSGDSGLFPGMKEIGNRLGPFDVTLIEVGQYHSAWADWHFGPEQALLAHQWVRGRTLIPVHWGLFVLSTHSWTEPVERVLAAAAESGDKVLVPRPGESMEPTTAPIVERWWPALPWKTAEEHPVVSTQLN